MSRVARLARLEAHAASERERRGEITKRLAAVLGVLARKPRAEWSPSEARVVELVELARRRRDAALAGGAA